MSSFRPLAAHKEDFRPTHRVEPEPGPAPAPNDPPPPRAPTFTPRVESGISSAAAAEAEVRARAEVQSQWTQAVETLRIAERLVAALEARRQALLRDGADVIGDVVRAMATKLVAESLALHPDALPGVIRRAAEILPSDPVRIRVPTSDLARIQSLLPPRLAAALEADPDLDGGVIVESERASIDASLEAAREGIDKAVAAWRQDVG